MINPITSFSVASVDRNINGDTTIDFQFIKPVIGKVGGYYLYTNTSSGYTTLDVKIESLRHKELAVSTYDDDLGYTHFIETLSENEYQGRQLSFYIAAISTSREFSTSSGIVTVDTFPSPVIDLFAKYDSYEVTLSWEGLTTLLGENSDFSYYEIYLSQLEEIYSTTLDTTNTSLLLNSSFTVGQNIYVKDIFKKSQWYGVVSSTGQLDLTNLKLTNSSDISDIINIDSLVIYTESSTGYLIGTTTGTSYIDTSFIKETNYLYKVRSITTAGRESDFLSYPISTLAVTYGSPYLRSISNSTTIYYENLTCNSSTGQTSLTLSITPKNYLDIEVSVNNIILTNYIDYIIVDDTITFTTALVLNDIINVIITSDLTSNKYWQNIKATLIDKHYYDLSSFAIPYSKKENYILKGYFGISDCILDVYINGVYGITTSTGQYGEFELNYKFPKGETRVVFQVRDKNNIIFSPVSNEYSIKTINLYTWYSVFGSQYKQIETELDLSRQDISVANARYSSFTDRFQPLIELYKVGAEDDTKFRALAYEIFKMFEFVGYNEGINIFLDALAEESITDNWDHYEIYYNNSLYDSIQTGFSFIQKKIDPITLTSTGLSRQKYIYGITCLTSTGEETDASFLTVDTRWWVPSTLGINILEWTPVYEIPYYNIYRGTSTGNITYLTTITGNIFVDNNSINSSSTTVSPIYNFTDYEPPTNLKKIKNTKISEVELYNRRPHWMEVVLYAIGSYDILDYQLERIIFFLKKLIPPEIKFLFLYCNDMTVKSTGLNLPPAYYRLGGTESTGLFLDFTRNTFDGLPLEYARYYESYYDITYYQITALYENTITPSTGITTIKWDAVGTVDMIKFQYMTSNNGITWSAWSTAVNAVDYTYSTIGVQIFGVQVKYRFIYYSPLWTDPEKITITYIEE